MSGSPPRPGRIVATSTAAQATVTPIYADAHPSPSMEEALYHTAEADEQHEHTDESTSSGGAPSSSHSSTLFFADATLDLDEAHDIAETPEPVKPTYVSSKEMLQQTSRQLQMPVLSTTFEEQGHPGNKINTSEDNNNNISPLELENGNANAPTSAAAAILASSKSNFTRITSVDVEQDTNVRPRNPPRWPRDIPWAIAFFVVVPTSLLWPLLRSSPVSSSSSSTSTSNTNIMTLSSHPLSTMTLHALLWSVAATFVLSRLLYNSLAAGDGDDARHRAAQFMVLCAPCHVATTAALTVFLWWACSSSNSTSNNSARIVVLVPLWFTAHDLYFFRKWKQRAGDTYSNNRAAAAAPETTRQAFFQALAAMALDILSRSLRRASFLRVMTGLLVLQLGVVLWWRLALLAALRHVQVVGLDLHNALVLAATVLGGKWGTGTVARMLTLLACGGVTGWFLDQMALLRELPTAERPRAASQDSDGDGNGGGYTGGSGAMTTIPDAYRTADASVYQSVLDMDDALDDDFDLEEEELLESPNYQRRMQEMRQHQQGTGNYGGGRSPHQQQHRSTVKSILWAGLSVSFGSVAQCGLVGGLAQFVWSQIRKVEAARWAITQRQRLQQQHHHGTGGFQGMQIGGDVGSGRASFAQRFCGSISQVARGFVTRYSDLAMSHVAAYYKNYHRAARDVAALIEQSGVEPILHDDITTHLCACVGGSISGVIVIITGYLLVHQRTKDVTDWQIAENILLAFVLSYTLIFTVMEPLRAAVKAVYVSFAQHPQSLSQAFPLIYHRLTRLSESQVS